MRKVIDFEKYGNVVRFIMGDADLENWGGDDWNDSPYEDNAGSVYDQYEMGQPIEVAWGGNYLVKQPIGIGASKDGMKNRTYPMIVVLKTQPEDGWYSDSYIRVVSNEKAVRFYMGMDEEDLKALVALSGGTILC